MGDDLLPCPFCGAKAARNPHGINCMGCMVHMPEDAMNPDAEGAWNDRTATPAHRLALAALVGAGARFLDIAIATGPDQLGSTHMAEDLRSALAAGKKVLEDE